VGLPLGVRPRRQVTLAAGLVVGGGARRRTPGARIPLVSQGVITPARETVRSRAAPPGRREPVEQATGEQSDEVIPSALPHGCASRRMRDSAPRPRSPCRAAHDLGDCWRSESAPASRRGRSASPATSHRDGARCFRGSSSWSPLPVVDLCGQPERTADDGTDSRTLIERAMAERDALDLSDWNLNEPAATVAAVGGWHSPRRHRARPPWSARGATARYVPWSLPDSDNPHCCQAVVAIESRWWDVLDA
jgi:hypothetical protein